MAKVNPFRFSTKYQDDETDLLYYGYRYYSASTGRWASHDPIGEKGFRRVVSGHLVPEAQPPNLYEFSGNEPLRRFDYLGLNSKFDPPPGTSCKDPCEWARRHVGVGDEVPPGTAGIIVCCNGKPYPCVIKPGGISDAKNPTAKQIITGCILWHEEQHVPVVKCRKKCGWTGPTTDADLGNAADILAKECAAYRAEMECLKGGLPGCDGLRDCEQEVQAEIRATQLGIDKYCN